MTPRGGVRTQWAALSRTERWAVAVLGTVQLGLHGAALWDLHGRSRDEVRGPRWAWAAASFISFFGPIAYFTVGRRR